MLVVGAVWFILYMRIDYEVILLWFKFAWFIDRGARRAAEPRF
jgi:hypothetical protein